ncbi:MAG TPA: hypothetical protein VGO26_08745 [Amnibacterium sp.]|nr:hypothetical protein [Amnibacterium sp.]
MKHIAYTDTVIDTEGRLADLVLEYAKVLARTNSADTISIPYRSGSGTTERITMLVGPASQLTSWGEDDGDSLGPVADEAAEELQRLIRERTPTPVAPEPAAPEEGIDDFDDLGRPGD